MGRRRRLPEPGQTFRRLKDVDSVTREWIRTPGDEQAALNGCWFDVDRAQHVEDWCKDHLRLYEGRWAKEPFTFGDWQLDCIWPMFGWVRWDEEWSAINKEPTFIRRFNQAVIVIAKKNGKSPTLAALAMYLTCGDGEQGAKCGIYAKDGAQVRKNVAKHVQKMYEQSPFLMKYGKFNKNEMSFEYFPTNSSIVPESSGDERTQKAKEGFNGNILVDEIHVVDRATMGRVSRAGISREEPFQIEVTTAGKDPDSYGKERVDYARRVLRGVEIDQRLFVQIYEAPQDLTPTELDKDPEKFIKMANPSLGRIVRMNEVLEDYETSKRKGLLEIYEFMMYRLDVWQSTAHPMIDPRDWEACGVESSVRDGLGFEIEALYGCGGGMGLDLAKTNDMCACTFTSTVNGKPHQFTYLWMTEDYAEKMKVKVKGFIEWGAIGHLILVNRRKILDEDILTVIRPHLKKIKPTLMVYDETFCTDIADKIQDELGGEKAFELAPRGQTYEQYTEPTQMWLEDIKTHDLRHPHNKALNWQTNVVLCGRRDKYIKPIKDKDKEHLKIDGICSSIMSHVAWRRAPVKESVYKTRGILCLN